jgi:hypothetical protein
MGPSLAFAPLRRTKDCAQDDSVRVGARPHQRFFQVKRASAANSTLTRRTDFE